MPFTVERFKVFTFYFTHNNNPHLETTTYNVNMTLIKINLNFLCQQNPPTLPSSTVWTNFNLLDVFPQTTYDFEITELGVAWRNSLLFSLAFTFRPLFLCSNKLKCLLTYNILYLNQLHLKYITEPLKCFLGFSSHL